MTTVPRDRWDYIGRMRQQRLAEELRDRRREAIRAVSQVSVQVTSDGKSVDELIFDRPPTLAELMESAGPDSYVIAIERLHRAPKAAAVSRPMAAE